MVSCYFASIVTESMNTLPPGEIFADTPEDTRSWILTFPSDMPLEEPASVLTPDPSDSPTSDPSFSPS